MESKARLLGHPVHQMLIVFPLGLLGTSVVFDVLYFATGNGRWADVGYWLIAAGVSNSSDSCVLSASRSVGSSALALGRSQERASLRNLPP